MFAMRMARKTRYRRVCKVYFERCRDLGRVRIVLRRRLSRGVLGLNPSGRYGGTVEPPCDFQKQSIGLPEYKGLSP